MIVVFVALLLVVIPLTMALPTARTMRSWKHFGAAFVLSLGGIIVPLLVFLASSFLIPDWKGACRYGWLDCFHLGKLALLPLVLWACAAFYAQQVLRAIKGDAGWIQLGLFAGAFVSSVCLLFGLLVAELNGGLVGLLVPLYTAVLYTVLWILSVRRTGLASLPHFLTFLGSLPFWLAALYWSKKTYLGLPEDPPDCFVVSAALGGHECVVGPRVTVEHGGRQRRANGQLLTFWRLEKRWQQCSPRTHSLFRRVYDRLGPTVAAGITSPWRADLAYLALKPLELAARLVLAVSLKRVKRVADRTP